MTLGDGTTTLTLQSEELRNDSVIVSSRKSTAGGELRTRTIGERFETSETVRINGDDFRALMQLITNNAQEYFYTPDIIPPEWDSADFPMSVAVDYLGKDIRGLGNYNGTVERLYYINLAITSNQVFNQ